MTRKQRPPVRLRLESLEDRLVPSWSGVPAQLNPVPPQSRLTQLYFAGDATGTATIATNEVDYYWFTAGRTGPFTFIVTTTATNNLQAALGVFDAQGRRIGYALDTSATDTDCRVNVNLTAGRTYFLGVTNRTGTPGGAYRYTIDDRAVNYSLVVNN